MEVNCPHCGKSTSLGEVYPVAAPPSPSVIPSSRPQLPPSKAKPDNAVLFNVQWVASVIAGVLVLCNVAAEKWKQRKVAARAESAAVSPPTPIPDYSEEIMALLKPETRRLPKDFTTQWNGDGSGTKAAMDAARQAQAGKLFALVLETKYTRALPLQPEIPGFGLIAATLRLCESPSHPSPAIKPQSWVMASHSSPGRMRTAQNALGAKVVVTAWDEDVSWFENTDVSLRPAYACDGSGGSFYKSLVYNSYSSSWYPSWRSTHSDWTVGDLLMYPLRGTDGKRLAQAQLNEELHRKSGLTSLIAILVPELKPISRDELQRTADATRAVLLYRLSPPFIKGSESYGGVRTATLSNPNEDGAYSSRRLYGSVFAVVFYDSRSDYILAKVDLAKTSTEQFPAEYQQWDMAALHRIAAGAVNGFKDKDFQIIDARWELALRYALGEGVPVDTGIAGQFIQGLPPHPEKYPAIQQAAVARATALARHAAMAEPDKRGVELLKKQADAGGARAQYELGVRYLTGKNVNVKKNEKEAVKLLRDAAAQGYQQATKKLAELGINPE